MRSRDVTLVAPHRPGTLAVIGEELGTAGINIDGLCAFEFQGRAVIHLLVDDAPVAREVLERFESVGFEIRDVTEVLVVDIEDAPGALGMHAHAVADAGVNLTVAYPATGSRLVLGADDIEALEAAWRRVTAAAV